MSDFIHQDDGSYLVRGQSGQDLKDGAALRKLREALPAWAGWEVSGDYTAPDITVVWAGRLGDSGYTSTGKTIAEAADKCREALT